MSVCAHHPTYLTRSQKFSSGSAETSSPYMISYICWMTTSQPGPPASSVCQQRLDIILATCYYPRVPIAPEKLILPSTLLAFWASSSTACTGRHVYSTRSSPNYVHFWMPSRHVTPAQTRPQLARQTELRRVSRRRWSHLHAPLVGLCIFHAGAVPPSPAGRPPARRICGGRTTCLPDGTADHSSCTTTCPWPHSPTAALTRLAQLATELTSTTAAGSVKHGRPSNNTVASSIWNSIRSPSRAPFGVWNGLPDGSSSIQTTRWLWQASETAPVAAPMLISTPSGS